MPNAAPPEQPTLAEHFVQYAPFVLAGIREVHYSGLSLDPETGTLAHTENELSQLRDTMTIHGIIRSRIDAGNPVPPIPGAHRSFSVDEIVRLHGYLRQARLELSVYFSAETGITGATYVPPVELLEIDPEVEAYAERLSDAYDANPTLATHLADLISTMRVAYAQIRYALELTVDDLAPEAPMLAEKHLMRGYRGALESLLFRASRLIGSLKETPAFTPYVTLIDAVDERSQAWRKREMFIVNMLLHNARAVDAPAAVPRNVPRPQRGTS